MDYSKTFTSTSIPPTWRILLAFAAAKDWEIEQIDFIGAFLNSDLDVDIYLSTPEGFSEWLATATTEIKRLAKSLGFKRSEKQVILLKKALYGLKQGFRKWQNKLVFLLNKKGYKQLISDPAVFFNAKTKHFIITFINDCLVIGPNITYINALKRSLHKVYALENRGPAAYFLGVQIIRDRPNRQLWIYQSQYIDEMLKTFGLNASRFISIPLQPGVLKDTKGQPITFAKTKLLQRIVSTVIYLMLLTCPDIGFAVQ